jgi:hypothetical protein
VIQLLEVVVVVVAHCAQGILPQQAVGPYTAVDAVATAFHQI